MKAALFILLALIAVPGCGQKEHPPTQNVYLNSIFDAALTNAAVQARVKQVEQDLPDDVHKSVGQGTPRPVTWNDTRKSRELAIANDLLRTIRPSLKRMSVSQLVAALKIYPIYSANCPPGVAYWLYSEGNQTIINEIKSRPAAELGPLKVLAHDKKSEVFINASDSQGLGALCQTILTEKGIPSP